MKLDGLLCVPGFRAWWGGSLPGGRFLPDGFARVVFKRTLDRLVKVNIRAVVEIWIRGFFAAHCQPADLSRNSPEVSTSA